MGENWCFWVLFEMGLWSYLRENQGIDEKMVKNMKIGDLGPFFDAGEFWSPQGELGDWCQKEGLKMGKN